MKVKYPRDYIRPPYVQISLRTHLNMRDEEFGQRLAEILWASEPRYCPNQIGLDFEKATPCLSHDDFLDKWCVLKTRTYNGTDYQFPQKIWWKNKSSLKCEGSFGHKFTATTGADVPGSLMVTFAYRGRIDWKEMFLSLCELMQPQLAMMHVFTEETCSPNERESTFQCGHFSGLSDPKIPGLGWFFAAGGEFYKPVMEFDLLGLDIDRRDCESYCMLEISKGAEEVITSFDTFETRREQLMKIFPLPIVENYDSLGL